MTPCSSTQRTTRRHIPEDDTLHNHRCENRKSYSVVLCPQNESPPKINYKGGEKIGMWISLTFIIYWNLSNIKNLILNFSVYDRMQSKSLYQSANDGD
jgi:hypothetical protein